MKTNRTIPLYPQEARAIGGITIRKLPHDRDAYPHDVVNDHRDDHFNLMVATKGSGILRCDMQDISLKAPGIIIIKPYQVHSVVHTTVPAGGDFVSIAPFLIPDNCNAVFQNLAVAQQALHLPKAETKRLLQITDLMHTAFQEPSPYQSMIVNGLFTSLIGRAAMLYAALAPAKQPSGFQAALLTAKFRDLISAYSFLETPSFFASKLNITTSHLNDSVRSVTGYSITYWLQQTMILEAKRLLYYTDNDIKEVGYTLGYEDHAYFSRLFKKITRETPLAFRKKFRE